MKAGDLTKSGNFRLEKKIISLDEFWIAINEHKSIFARHRMYPSSFFLGWNIKLINTWLDRGWFFIAEKVDKE